MSSQARIEANRRNAQLSTGPRTREGKYRSRLNATRHGLTGHTLVMHDQDRQQHDRFCHDLIQKLQAVSPLEIQLAQAIAEDTWRINRLRALEENMFSAGLHERASRLNRMAEKGWDDRPKPGDLRHDHRIDTAFTAAETFIHDAKAFQLLSLYEQRLSRTLHRNIQTFRDLQAERKKAATPAQLPKKKEPPLPVGFDFSKTLSPRPNPAAPLNFTTPPTALPEADTFNVSFSDVSLNHVSMNKESSVNG